MIKNSNGIAVVVSVLSLGLLCLFTYFTSSIVNAQALTGSIASSDNNSTWLTVARRDTLKNGNTWIRWTAQNETDCTLFLIHSPTNKEYIAGAESTSIQLNTSTVGDFNYSLQCDDATVAGYNMIEVAHFINGVYEAAGGPGNQAPTPMAWSPDPDCVFGYPKRYMVNAHDPENNPFRLRFYEDGFGTPLATLPSTATYFTTDVAGSLSVTYTHPPSPGAAGIWSFPYIEAIDSLGARSELLEITEYAGVGNSVFVTNEQLCVFNLDEGLSGGDSDGTDLVVIVNGSARSASNISISTGDQISFEWRSALMGCTSNAGLMIWQTGGTQSNITEPAAGQSATYNVTCNTSSFTQSETITVTNGTAIPPIIPPEPTGPVTANVFAVINNATQDSSYVPIYPGDTTQTVAWTQSGATSCTLTGPNGINKTSNRTSDNVSLAAPPVGSAETYYLACSSASGAANDSITIEMVDPTPPPPPAPQVYLNSTINSGSVNTTSALISINEGDQVKLGWTSAAVAGCTGTNFNTSNADSNYVGVDITEPAANTQQTYSISCNSPYGYPAVNDSITVMNRGTNNAPTPPTITGTTTGYTGVTNPFQVTGSTDANGDNLTYYVDWDNNGSYDTYSSPPRNPVGYTYTPSRSWSSAGAKTFCVWANDGRGGVSTKTCHTITVSVPPPPVLNLTVNGSSGSVNVHYNDNMTIAWTVSRSMSCTLTGAGVNGWSGTASVGSSGSITVDTDYISTTGTGDETYVLSCGGYTDSVYVDAINNALSFEVQENSNPWSMNSIIVASNSTIRLRWNYTDWGNCSGTNFNTGGSKSHAGLVVTTPSAGQSRTYTISCGFTPYTASLTVTSARSNFTTPIVNTPTFGTFSTTTNQYNNISLIFRTENNDGSPTPANADYRFEFDLGNNGTYETVVNRTNALESLAPGAGTNKTEQVTNVPPGVHRVRITVDSGNEATESNETDNVYTGTITIPAQDPGVSISVNSPQVRHNDTAVISWIIGTPAPTLSCVVSGPGLTPQTYTASGNLTTPPITAKSEYSLRCTDSSTGTIWQRSVSVETTGTVEEV